MMSITASTISNFLTRPIGYTLSKSKKDVKQWAKDERPGVLKSVHGAAIVSSATALFGIIVSLFGFRNDHKLSKWIGIPIAAVSLLISSLSFKVTKDNLDLVKKEKEELNKFSIRSVKEKLEEISTLKSNSEKNGLRYKFLKSIFNSNDTSRIGIIYEISKQAGDLSTEAGKLIELINIQEKNEEDLINVLRDKSVHEDTRFNALIRLSSDSMFGVNYQFKNLGKSILDVLLEEASDKNNSPKMREEFLMKLVDMPSEKAIDTMVLLLKDPSEECFILNSAVKCLIKFTNGENQSLILNRLKAIDVSGLSSEHSSEIGEAIKLVGEVDIKSQQESKHTSLTSGETNYNFRDADELVSKIRSKSESDDERISSFFELNNYFGKDFNVQKFNVTPLTVISEEIKDKSNSVLLRERMLKELKSIDSKKYIEISLGIIGDQLDNLSLREKALNSLLAFGGHSGKNYFDDLLSVNLEPEDLLKKTLYEKIANSLGERKGCLRATVDDLVEVHETHVIKGSIDYDELTVLSRNLDLKSYRARIKQMPREITQEALIRLIENVK